MKKLFPAVILAFLAVLPIVSAVNVNIIYEGQTLQTTQFNAEDVMNWDISIERNATDFTWSRVNVHVSVISGDSARPIGKIYLYRCKAYNSIDCITKVDVPEPLEFGSYADADLSWNDISASVGNTRYPQAANLLFVAKLEGGNEAWVGLFVRIERVDYNQFNVPFNYELESVNVFPKAENLVEPVKEYIDNFHMIPMRWVDRVMFTGALGLYALGANREDFESQPVNFRPERPVGEIRQITKDFYLVFPETVEGVANPITLNLNPISECGDGTCQASLGESSVTCCYDCGCPSGQFCDVPDPSNPADGVCTETDIRLGVSGILQNVITDCEGEGISRFTARIINPPTGLITQEFSGTLEIEDFVLPVDCLGSPSALDCSFEYSTEIICGEIEREFEYVFTLPVEYYDGQNTVMVDLRADNIGNPGTIRYRCECEEGMYCDVRENVCQDEESIMLSLLEFRTPRYNINTGGVIKMFVQIEYAPPDYTLSSARYNIREILQDEYMLPGLSGLMNCTSYEDYEEPDVYECEIKYSITGYDRGLEYILSNNKIIFKINYEDVGTGKTKTLATEFPDVVIPPSECGDGRCDKEKGESERTCCLDCGCGRDETLYCDEKKGCQSIDAVGLTVQSAKPTSFEDCAEEHTMNVKALIGRGSQGSSDTGGGVTGMGIVIEPTDKFGVPTGIVLESYELFEDEGLSEYASLSCGEINEVTGALRCQVEISPIEECLTTKSLGPFEMQIAVSWPDGFEDVVSKTLTATLPQVSIKPVFHPGDGVCEENYGESAANSCVDCPCEEDPQFGPDFYCDVGSGGSKTGICKSKSNVNLVIDSPKQTVYFSSCDIDNEVQIRAHIANAPGGTRMEYASALVNGEYAQISCTQLFGMVGGGGLRPASGGLGGWVVAKPAVTGMGIAVEPEEPCPGCGIKPPGGMVGTSAGVPYNCVLIVPAEDDCQENKTYRHTAVMEIYISYNNGNNIDMGVVSASLPEIVVNPREAEGVEGDEIDVTVADIERSLEEKLKVVEELKEVEGECTRWFSGTNIATTAKAAGTVAANLGVAALCVAFPEAGCNPVDVIRGGVQQTIRELGLEVTLGSETQGADLTGDVITRDVTGMAAGDEDEPKNSILKQLWEAVLEVGQDVIASPDVTVEIEGLEVSSDEEGLSLLYEVPGLEVSLDGDGLNIENFNLGEFSFDFLNLDKKAGELIVDIGADLIRSQRAKCGAAKAQREMIEKDLKLETEEILFMKCIGKVQEMQAAGQCEGMNAFMCRNEYRKCIEEMRRKLGEYGYLIDEIYSDIKEAEDAAQKAAQKAAEAAGHWKSSQGDFLSFECGDFGPTKFCCGTRGNMLIKAACGGGTTSISLFLDGREIATKGVEAESSEKLALEYELGGRESISQFFGGDGGNPNGNHNLVLSCSDGRVVKGGFIVCYCDGDPQAGCTTEYVAENCPECAEQIMEEEEKEQLCTPEIIEFCESQGKVCDEETGKCVDCKTDEDCVKKGLKRCLKKEDQLPRCVECVEDDDCATGYCDKNSCIGPDIVIAPGSIAVCLTGDEAGIDAIGFYVKNQGEETIFDEFQVRLDTKRTKKEDDHLNLKMIYRLDAGDHVWRYRNFAGGTGAFAPLTGGDRVRKVTIRPDHDNRVVETNEENNVREVEIRYDGVHGADEVYKAADCPGVKGPPKGLKLEEPDEEKGKPEAPVAPKPEEQPPGEKIPVKPDLTVIPSSVDVTVNKAELGDRIRTISFIVKNQGTGSSRSLANGIKIVAHHYRDNNPQDEFKTGENWLNIPALDPNEQHELKAWEWYVSYLRTYDYVGKVDIIIDPDGKVEESDEGNNCFTVDAAGIVNSC